jgi:CheY-like chemotaxis protein
VLTLIVATFCSFAFCTSPLNSHHDRVRLDPEANASAEYAADGSEAISLAKRYKPDLVILDLAMPKMNGLETARELRKIMPTVSIILLTLHASTVRELFAGDSCVDLVIPKGDFTRLTPVCGRYFAPKEPPT